MPVNVLFHVVMGATFKS